MTTLSSAPETDLRYPLGRPTLNDNLTPDERADAIRTLAETPEQLREALRGLNDVQLDTPYRPGGWSVRMLTHHIADSHMAAFFRMRKALVEDYPAIEGYDEQAFAALPDHNAPAEWSADIVEGLHARWTTMLSALTDDQWKRGILHAERGRMNLSTILSLYAWHAQHHVAHIQALRLREGW